MFGLIRYLMWLIVTRLNLLQSQIEALLLWFMKYHHPRLDKASINVKFNHAIIYRLIKI